MRCSALALQTPDSFFSSHLIQIKTGRTSTKLKFSLSHLVKHILFYLALGTPPAFWEADSYKMKGTSHRISTQLRVDPCGQRTSASAERRDVWQELNIFVFK
jgi:hypothetical protein